jgi:UDP-GlcNAc:undecaprenyl-phosphate/decaprenyl-phosphate GlcNAc-1-phosphate transferase
VFFPTLFYLLLGSFVSWLVIQLSLDGDLGTSGRRAGPQHHHTHVGIIPRIGGLGIAAGFASTYLLCFFFLDEQDNQSLMHYAIFSGGALAFLLGFVDDLHPLGAKVKLLSQIIIALLAHSAGLEISQVLIPFTNTVIEFGLFSLVVTVFWIVAIMNLINLIDGLDGLAGGIGLMLMCLLAYLAYSAGISFSFILSLGMVGAILGFLFHNFPPAKVYMGDSGAYLIGYVIATISLLNSEKGTVLAALIAPVLALALPICDVAFAILRRAIRGLPLFRPDQEHIHHRLMKTGMSRQKTVLVLYGLSLFALIAGLLAFAAQGRYLPIFLGLGFVVFLFAMRGQKLSPQSLSRRLNESVQSRSDTKNALYLRDWLVAEAERADKGEHLWADFRFVLKKMGFCRAELKMNGALRSFYVPNTGHADTKSLWQAYRSIPGVGELWLYAEKDNLAERQFEIVADIAIEAWTQAANRWLGVNGETISFEAEATPPQSYRAQKARNLYRPTY